MALQHFKHSFKKFHQTCRAVRLQYFLPPLSLPLWLEGAHIYPQCPLLAPVALERPLRWTFLHLVMCYWAPLPPLLLPPPPLLMVTAVSCKTQKWQNLLFHQYINSPMWTVATTTKVVLYIHVKRMVCPVNFTIHIVKLHEISISKCMFTIINCNSWKILTTLFTNLYLRILCGRRLDTKRWLTRDSTVRNGDGRAGWYFLQRCFPPQGHGETTPILAGELQIPDGNRPITRLNPPYCRHLEGNTINKKKNILKLHNVIGVTLQYFHLVFFKAVMQNKESGKHFFRCLHKLGRNETKWKFLLC